MRTGRRVFVGMVAASLFTLACTKDPNTAVVPVDLAKWDTELKPSLEKLSEEEQQLFAGYAGRMKASQASGGLGLPAGQTVGGGVEDQRQFEKQRVEKETFEKAQRAQQKALKATIMAEREETERVVNELLKVSIYMISLNYPDWRTGRSDAEQIFQIIVSNRSDKDISGFKGRFVFSTMLGVAVFHLDISVTDTIQAGKERHISKTMEANRRNEYHRIFRDNIDHRIGDTIADSLGYSFQPKSVVFADGTRIVVPDETAE
jgi:hypothetical protein